MRTTVLLAALLGACSAREPARPPPPPPVPALVDDWVAAPSLAEAPPASLPASRPASQPASQPTPASQPSQPAPADFRALLEAGILPHATAVADDRLLANLSLADAPRDCKKPVCPVYLHAVSRDPLSGQPEHFLLVGLGTGIAPATLTRRPLDLALALDLSGRIADLPRVLEAAAALVHRLRPGDRLAVVLFAARAHVAKPLGRVGETDLEALTDHLAGLTAAADAGAPRVDLALETAGGLLTAAPDREARVIVVGSGLPVAAETTDPTTLTLAVTRRLAERRVSTTFVFLGGDPAALAAALARVRGADLLELGADELRRRLVDELDALVTPIALGFAVSVETKGFEVAAVYGAEPGGPLLRAGTLFLRHLGEDPAARPVLVRLRAGAPEGEVTLRVESEGPSGRESDALTLRFPPDEAESFPSPDLRRAVLEARFLDLVRCWLVDDGRTPPVAPSVTPERGIPRPDLAAATWPDRRGALHVSPGYVQVFGRFRPSFATEAAAIGAPELLRDLRLVDLLIGGGNCLTRGGPPIGRCRK